jgi:hypothetical protein
MKLTELDAWFLGNCDPVSRGHSQLDGIAGAQGGDVSVPEMRRRIGARRTRTRAGRWPDRRSTIFTLMPSVNCDVPHKDAAGVEHPSSCKFHGWVKNGDVA